MSKNTIKTFTLLAALGGLLGVAALAIPGVGPLAAAGGLLLRPALGGLRRSMDPNSFGGAVRVRLLWGAPRCRRMRLCPRRRSRWTTTIITDGRR